MDTCDYLAAVFDHERAGLRHLGEQVISLLDLRSLVALKRTCHLLHAFLTHLPHLEERALEAKLRLDWQCAPSVRGLDLPPTAAVTSVKLVEDGKRMLAGIGKSVHLLPNCRLSQPPASGEGGPLVPPSAASGTVVEGLRLRVPLPSTSLTSKASQAFPGLEDASLAIRTFTNTNDNLEKNQVTEFDTMHSWLVVGNNNGTLSVWDIHTGELLVTKQLFGIVSGVRCLPAEDTIVTTHAGKAFDMGVVSVRRMVSPTELTVLWSAYQDILPIFSFDVSSKWIVTLEWLGTFDMVHVGSASVYSRQEGHIRR